MNVDKYLGLKVYLLRLMQWLNKRDTLHNTLHNISLLSILTVSSANLLSEIMGVPAGDVEKGKKVHLSILKVNCKQDFKIHLFHYSFSSSAALSATQSRLVVSTRLAPI